MASKAGIFLAGAGTAFLILGTGFGSGLFVANSVLGEPASHQARVSSPAPPAPVRVILRPRRKRRSLRNLPPNRRPPRQNLLNLRSRRYNRSRSRTSKRLLRNRWLRWTYEKPRLKKRNDVSGTLNAKQNG